LIKILQKLKSIYIYNNLNSFETLKTNELEKQMEIFETRTKNDEKYIENLTKQLDQQNSNVNTLNKLLENQQILGLENNKKIKKEKKEDSTNEDILEKDDKPSEEIESGPEDREVETPKKGVWSRLFGS
jgi:uncharacterized coiled-coil protein SlyX